MPLHAAIIYYSLCYCSYNILQLSAILYCRYILQLSVTAATHYSSVLLQLHTTALCYCSYILTALCYCSYTLTAQCYCSYILTVLCYCSYTLQLSATAATHYSSVLLQLHTNCSVLLHLHTTAQCYCSYTLQLSATAATH